MKPGHRWHARHPRHLAPPARLAWCTLAFQPDGDVDMGCTRRGSVKTRVFIDVFDEQIGVIFAPSLEGLDGRFMFGQLRPKPDARMLRAVAVSLGVPASRCVLVEDALAHRKSARKVGMGHGVDAALLAPLHWLVAGACA